jgi:integral membrane protein
MKGFKQIALLEGVSLLLLIFFAMPMKYVIDEPIYVRVIGMIHGVLFIIYILWAVLSKFKENWEWSKFLIICAASVIPFGTFYIDRKYLKKNQSTTN